MSRKNARLQADTIRATRAATQSSAGAQPSRPPGAPSTSEKTPGAKTPTGWADRLEQELLQEVVAATYWFDSGERGKPYSVSIRFSGRRTSVTGKPQPRDHFVQVETVEGIVPASGPVSITTLASDITPGDWIVTADVIRKSSGRSARPYPRTYDSDPRKTRRLWLWPKRPTSGGSAAPVKTRLLPFARIPGIWRPAWPALVGLGVLVGLAVQALLVARAHLDVRAAFAVSLSASVAGYAGAKAWFLIRQGRGLRSLASEGLCIQGFLVAGAIVVVAASALLHMPLGTFLDAATPGLLFGLAVGRPGCVFAGCCSGRPTASRWGVWASDRRLGTRRVPTQLLESLLCLVIGVVALILVLQYRPALPGAVFVGALAGYTFGRQLLFPFRAEPRRSAIGRPLTMAAAGLVLIADIVLSIVA